MSRESQTFLKNLNLNHVDKDLRPDSLTPEPTLNCKIIWPDERKNFLLILVVQKWKRLPQKVTISSLLEISVLPDLSTSHIPSVE